MPKATRKLTTTKSATPSKPIPAPKAPVLGAAAAKQANAGRSNVAKPAASTPSVAVAKPTTAPVSDIERLAAGHLRKQSRHPFAYPASGIDVRDTEYLAFIGAICKHVGRVTGITGADIAKHAASAGAIKRDNSLRFPSPSGNLKNSITDGGRQSRLCVLGLATKAGDNNALSITKLGAEHAAFTRANRSGKASDGNA